MNTPLDIYQEAARRGLRLEPAGDKLAVFPKGKCTPDFADVLRANKPALLEWLSRQPCPGYGTVPPSDLPVVNVKSRPSIHSRELVIHYILRQTDNRANELSAWLARRETHYFDGPGGGWDCADIAYATARDAACWQLNRSESEVWKLLAGFDAATSKSTKDKL